MKRRLRRVRVHAVTFVNFLKHGVPRPVRVVEHALPEDATYVYGGVDPASGMVWLFVESASFEEVDEYAVVPEHPDVVVDEVLDARQKDRETD